jgi:YtcA family
MSCFRKGCAVEMTGGGVAAAMLTTGCASAPSINVLGAYFPDWLFCIVAGVVLAVIVYRILGRTPYGDWVGPTAVIYPTLVTFLALVVWLIFFQH